MIARMQIRQTAWDTLLAEYQICVDTETCSLSEGIQRILRQGATQEIKDAQNSAGFILMNVISAESRIDELWDYFAAGDKIGYGDSNGPWKWGFNGKVNFETEYTGQHNDILATQPAGSTFEDPQWSHGWQGQQQNKFARAYNRSYGESYG